MNNSKKFVLQSILVIMCLLILLGGVTVYIDPYFHYHRPLDEFEYPIDNERYQNDGISRFWEYDAIITGSSMAECFMTSEFDDLFDSRTIKITYSGGKYKEIDEAVRRALSRKSSINYVVRSLDFNYMILDKDIENEESVPEYLYDENIFNDVSYLFNKEILFEDVLGVIDYTNSGKQTTSFDEYANWYSRRISGKEEILRNYNRPEMAKVIRTFDEETKEKVRQNIEQNVLQTVKDNPDTQFYFFFPPYSIYWWDSVYRGGNLERRLLVEKYVIEMLLPYENVHLFSFFDNFDMICNADEYVDEGHYSEDINSYILECMKNNKNKLTKHNYENYCKKVYEFYMNYNYDGLFE